jgi:hypothetical protein
MNNAVKERIKNLAIQARREVKRPGVFTEAEFEQKFAELIVKECINIVGNATASPNGVQSIMNHFDIE